MAERQPVAEQGQEPRSADDYLEELIDWLRFLARLGVKLEPDRTIPKSDIALL